ncbi:uncharacterized protein LOC132062785 [Lycium ferocissimum]|uniref:uncharacterized protein LOC132062785 n=1 Tax=Lycium ferocissimum TaxID=112874 RepID=UPI002815F7D5|nr:uncharacterized protein LOC132062785 [Lycium ferocissimum]
MAKLEIQIKIRKTLKPSTPTLNHLRSLNLSLFDQMAPSEYVQYCSTTFRAVNGTDKIERNQLGSISGHSSIFYTYDRSQVFKVLFFFRKLHAQMPPHKLGQR